MSADPRGPLPLFPTDPTDAAMPELSPFLLLLGSVFTLGILACGVIGLGLVIRGVGRFVWGCG